MVVLAILDPAVASVDFWIAVGVVTGIAGIFTLGIQLNAGSTGILNVGQVGFMAIGAYTLGILVVDFELPMWLALLAGTAAAIIAALAIGLPSLRLRADYFAIATIAFAEIVRFVAQNARGLTGGNQGKGGFDRDWRGVSETMSSFFERLGLGDSHLLPLLVVTWGLFLLLLVVIRHAMRTPWGRVILTVREDEDAAQAIGKNVLAYKLQSLAIAASLGALAGFLFALQLRFLVPQSFDPTFTFLAYAAVILGGLGSYGGVVVGTVIVWVLLELTRFLELPISSDRIAAIRFVLVGLALILLSMARPQGLFGKREEMVLRD
ncbi:MAG: branched-chain amino acid ABC transporter permease [Gaiellaceae bacterium]